MTLALFAVELALAIAFAGWIVYDVTRRKKRTWLDEHVAKTILVHRRGEDPIAGVVVRLYRDALVLRHASVIVGNGERVPLAGDVVVPRPLVTLVQYDDDVSVAELDEAPVVPVRVQ